MDRLAFRGDSIHYVLRPGPGPTYQPNYVGDSAPTATAWSTGKRTQDGRLSQGPSAADNVPGPNAGYTTYMELARDAGKATGNVSTAEITDATPAAPSSHISQRACQGPADTRTTCPTEAKTAAHARPRLDRRAAGRRGLRPLPRRRPRALPAAADGRRDARTSSTTRGPRATRTSTPSRRSRASRARGRQKVLGLFNTSNMTTEFAPLFARTAAYYTANPGRDVQVQGGSETTRCQPQNRGNEPSLPEMTTQGALAARGRQGRLRAPGRGRLDRQARPRRRRLRPDRRDAGVRQRRRRRARLPGPASGHARDRHRRPLAHVADDVHDRRAGHRRELRDGPDRRQHADPRLLRHRRHRHRRDDQRLPAPHRRRGARVGVRPAGGRHPGHDRPDRHLLGADERPRPGGRGRHDADRAGRRRASRRRWR